MAVLEVRRIGEWRAVEGDMAEWAKERGILRRTDNYCKRRFASLEPEKYLQHRRVRQHVSSRGSPMLFPTF